MQFHLYDALSQIFLRLCACETRLSLAAVRKVFRLNSIKLKLKLNPLNNAKRKREKFD